MAEQITPEQHQQQHVKLHESFNLLLVCFLGESTLADFDEHKTPRRGAGSLTQTIQDLLQWSYEKTLAPSPPPEDWQHYAGMARDSLEFESDRQMICLALAELLLERPGWILPIRNIAKRIGSEITLDAFMGANRDRIEELRGPMDRPRRYTDDAGNEYEVVEKGKLKLIRAGKQLGDVEV